MRFSVKRLKAIYEEHEYLFFFAALVLSLGGAGFVVKVVDAYAALDLGWSASIFAFVAGALMIALHYLPPSHSLTFREASEAYKEVKREELQIGKERDSHAALSLVAAELSGNHKQVVDTIESKQFWPPRRALRREKWDAYNAELAGEPSITVVYARIVDAYGEVDRLNDVVASRAQGPDDRAYIFGNDQNTLERARTEIWFAIHGIDECLGRTSAV